MLLGVGMLRGDNRSGLRRRREPTFLWLSLSPVAVGIFVSSPRDVYVRELLGYVAECEEQDLIGFQVGVRSGWRDGVWNGSSSWERLRQSIP